MEFMHPLVDEDALRLVGKVGTELSSKTCHFEFGTDGTLKILEGENTHWTPTVASITDAPFYLVLGNEGSLIQYNSKKAVVYEIFPALIGLNNMVRVHYKIYNLNEDAYA